MAIFSQSSGLSSRPAIRFVHSGEVAFSREPLLFTTILGSCVAVCLHDRRRRWGGMNHFVHASSPNRPPIDASYGTIAIAQLVDRFLVAGSRLEDLEARVTGGGHVLPAVTLRVGDMNIREAVEQLAIWSLPVVYKDLGGNFTRRVEFEAHTGQIRCEHCFGSAAEAEKPNPTGLFTQTIAWPVKP